MAVVTTSTLRHTKLWSEQHHQQTSNQFLQAGCPSHVAKPNSLKALKAQQNRLCFASVIK